ncbi:hypothetical protein C8A03DRAFT_35193 [Achaetomium macrosporum]|uniref:Uncharacterized protein n=1 Tax=Achaetomium macrosporum TaxID=79813 RepID=A0AAN7H9T1_9PEZI|nr:hypothetical protein C8A03DRAFT_35193 [Achaetomium macrosporum]
MRHSVRITTIVSATSGVHATGLTPILPIRNVYAYPKNAFIDNIAASPRSPRTLLTLLAGIWRSWDIQTISTQPGSLTVRTVKFTAAQQDNNPTVKQLATVTNSIMLNGIAVDPIKPGLLMLADSSVGAVWCIDLASGAVKIVLSDPPVLASTGTVTGDY